MPYKDKQKQLEYKKAWNRRYYELNRDQERQRIVKRKQKISEWLANYKETLFCKTCGEKTAACLDFHHLEPRSKDFSVSQISSWGWGALKIEEEISKCVILCANCHRKLHAGLIQLS